MPADVKHRGAHVDFVEVGTLFPVYFDRNEITVENRRDLLVFKALVLHDVAPVTGGITNAEKDELVFRPRALDRFFSPGVPVHRIVSMLQQIGAGLVDELIGVRGLHSLTCDHNRRAAG